MLAQQTTRSAATDAYEAQQARYEREAALRAERKEAERRAREEEKARIARLREAEKAKKAAAQRSAAASSGANRRRVKFNFEQVRNASFLGIRMSFLTSVHSCRRSRRSWLPSGRARSRLRRAFHGQVRVNAQLTTFCARRLVNALQHVNREKESVQENLRVQDCLEKAKADRKALIRYIQLIDNDSEGDYIGTLIATNEQVRTTVGSIALSRCIFAKSASVADHQRSSDVRPHVEACRARFRRRGD